MNREIIILIGISGSGKTSWTTNFIKDHRGTVRINRDSIRLSLFGSLDDYYHHKDLKWREELVTEIEEHHFETAVNHNLLNIIVDNTNLKQSYINRWIQLSQDTNYTVKFKIFDIDLQIAKKRVLSRDVSFYIGNVNQQEYVDYIDKQYKQFIEIKKYLKTHHKSQIIL